MKIKLTERTKSFVESLTEEDKTKVIITEDALESSDEEISQRLRVFAVEEIKKAMCEFGEKAREINAKIQLEHPEYFE